MLIALNIYLDEYDESSLALFCIQMNVRCENVDLCY